MRFAFTTNFFLFPVGKRLEMESNDPVVVIQTLAMLQTELVFWKNYERHKHVVELYWRVRVLGLSKDLTQKFHLNHPHALLNLPGHPVRTRLFKGNFLSGSITHITCLSLCRVQIEFHHPSRITLSSSKYRALPHRCFTEGKRTQVTGETGTGILMKLKSTSL